MAPSAILPDYEPEVAFPNSKFNDWRDDLHANGYAVIKNSIPRDRATQYQERAYEWVKSFEKPINFDDPSTWKKENLPVLSKINTFQAYAIPHEKFMWDLRLEPGIIKPFADLWGTDQLLVSFDSLNMTFPNRIDVPPKDPWQHIDQSPLRRGMHCVQGVSILSPSGPEDGGLVVYPGSHKYNEEFFDTQTDKADWKPRDLYMFSDDELAWFEAKGVRPHKVCAAVGDLVLWDSRLIHFGSEPTEKSMQIRTAVYVTYTPARLANEEAIKEKKKCFDNWAGTTHWPHDNIVFRKTEATWPDGTVDPQSRSEPLEKPDMSDRMLQLAGVKAY